MIHCFISDHLNELPNWEALTQFRYFGLNNNNIQQRDRQNCVTGNIEPGVMETESMLGSNGTLSNNGYNERLDSFDNVLFLIVLC